MRIAVCDDKIFEQKKYSELLTKLAEKHGIALQISFFSSGEQLLFHLEDDMMDIVFLDINMTPINGIETARRMRELGYEGEIIFLTVSKEHVFEAFDVHAHHYIVKEETTQKKIEEIFYEAVSVAEEKQSEYITVRAIGEYRNIPLKKIRYFEVVQRLVTVYYGENDKFEFSSTIGKIETQLFGKGFARLSRFFLVSLNHIASMSYDHVVMIDGTTLPIGRKYYKTLKEEFTALPER